MNMFLLSQFVNTRKLSKKSVFPETLTYIADKNSIYINTIERKRRKRKIVWLNPPY